MLYAAARRKLREPETNLFFVCCAASSAAAHDTMKVMNDAFSPVRILFMGTPAFAVPVLQALADAAPARHWQLVGVATQPDRPAGRGKHLAAGPVKEAALAFDLPVLQPASLRKDPAAVEALRVLAPDLLVVAAYGLILSLIHISEPTRPY